MRSFRTTTAALLIVALSASPAFACKRDHQHKRSNVTSGVGGWQELLYGEATVALRRAAARADAASTKAELAKHTEPADLSAYEGLASWIDIFNYKPWANPPGAVRTLAKRGAKAIFLQTSTYGQHRSLYDREAIDQFLYHAHKRGMKVVAWYVPSFDQQGIDFARAKRAINYRSPSGHRFDSFGLDIEATHVSSISLRNKRLMRLSERIRRVAGPSYPLGAITPDPVIASYWPNFPYKRVSRIYDVFVPMGYWTFRARGFKEVREYTAEGVRNIEEAVGKKDVPIHFIGGIADDAGTSDIRGFTKAAREEELIGASLYDYPITDRRSWFEMRALSSEVVQRRREEAAAELEAEKERERLARIERREEEADERAKRRKRQEREADRERDKRKDGKSSKRDVQNDKRKQSDADRKGQGKREPSKKRRRDRSN